MKFNTVEDLVKFVASGSAKLPEWQTKLFLKYANEIQVHSNGELFYKIDRLFPNEHPQSKQHRIISFEPITKGSFWKGVNNVEEIFNNSSYSVEASQNTIDLVNSHTFENNQNLFSYFLKKWCEQALTTDPNALVVVYPEDYANGLNTNRLQFVPSNLVAWKDNDSVIFISEEESKTEKTLKTTRVANRAFWDEEIQQPNVIESSENTYSAKLVTEVKTPVYHAFTTEGFYRIWQDQKSTTSEWEFTFTPIKGGFIPVTTVGGNDAEKGVYESFFSSFVAFGNLALLMHSQHCAVNFMFAFPRMSEVEQPCDAPKCMGGLVAVPPSQAYPDGLKPCSTCKGTGSTVKQSPYKVYRRNVNLSELDESGKEALKYDDVKFYTPPVEILEYSKNEWKGYLELADESIYNSQKVKTGQVESAESKGLDRKDRYNFLSKISKVFYPCLRNVIQFYENYLNANPNKVSINIPYSLQIVSEEEAFSTLEAILLSAAPVVIKANEIENFINKFVSQSSPVKRFFSILKKIDILIYYTDDQIARLKSNGVITPKMLSIHAFAFPRLQQIYNEDPSFLSQDEAAIIARLTEDLKEFEPAVSNLRETLVENINDEE